ncbi:MAG: Type IV secretory pathway VirB4 subunit, partial [Parcubacteria group bacterium GW2011_GWB1_43_8]
MDILNNLLGKKNKADDREILPVIPREIYEAGVLRLQDIIAPSAMEITSNHIKIGEKVARVLFVMSYPRFLASNWFSPVINLDKVFDISIFIHPIDTASVLRQLQKKVAEVQSQIHMKEEKGFIRDPILDTAFQDLEDLRDKLQQAQEKLFNVGVYLTVYADNEEELNQTETEIKSILESKLVYVKPSLFQQKEGLETVFPLGTDKLDVSTQLNSSPISSLFPFVSFDLSSDKGILYGINRHNNSLVLFDRFSLENYNSVIFA